MGTVANVLHGIASFAVDGVDVGYTSDGVEYEKSVDTFEKIVDQEYDALDVIPTQWTIHVNTQFAEATLQNVYIAWNEVNAPVVVPGDTRTLDIGLTQEIAEHKIIFIGKCPEGNARTFTLYRAKIADAVAMSLKKDEQTVVPVSFRCLPDFSKAEASFYGNFVDTL